MHDPRGNPGPGHPVRGQKGIHIRSQMLLDHRGHIGREHNLKSLLGDGPAHHLFAVGVEGGTAVHHARPQPFRIAAGHLCRQLLAHQQCHAAAVAKQAGGNQIGHVPVVALPGQRAQFHAQQDCRLIRIRLHIICRARQPRSTCHAAQSKDRGALHMHRQPHGVDQPRLHRGAGNARHRHADNRAQLLRIQARFLQQTADGFLAESDRCLDPHIVGLAPGIQLLVGIQRTAEISPVHAGAPVQPLQHRRVFHPFVPVAFQCGHHFLLTEVVGRKSHFCPCNPHARSAFLMPLVFVPAAAILGASIPGSLKGLHFCFRTA